MSDLGNRRLTFLMRERVELKLRYSGMQWPQWIAQCAGSMQAGAGRACGGHMDDGVKLPPPSLPDAVFGTCSEPAAAISSIALQKSSSSLSQDLYLSVTSKYILIFSKGCQNFLGGNHLL